jgi:hypothetical protein
MQMLQPYEVDVLNYPNGVHMTFGTSSPIHRGCPGFWNSCLL